MVPAAGNFFFSALFGPLAARHPHLRHPSDQQPRRRRQHSGTFVVASAPAAYFGVVVAEATRQDSVLQVNERGAITWTLTDANPLRANRSRSMGLRSARFQGPFGPAGGSLMYSAQFWPAGGGQP